MHAGKRKEAGRLHVSAAGIRGISSLARRSESQPDFAESSHLARALGVWLLLGENGTERPLGYQLVCCRHVS